MTTKPKCELCGSEEQVTLLDLDELACGTCIKEAKEFAADVAAERKLIKPCPTCDHSDGNNEPDRTNHTCMNVCSYPAEADLAKRKAAAKLKNKAWVSNRPTGHKPVDDVFESWSNL